MDIARTLLNNRVASDIRYFNDASRRNAAIALSSAQVTVAYQRDPQTGQILSSNGLGYYRTNSITSASLFGTASISEVGAQTGFTDSKPV